MGLCLETVVIHFCAPLHIRLTRMEKRDSINLRPRGRLFDITSAPLQLHSWPLEHCIASLDPNTNGCTMKRHIMFVSIFSILWILWYCTNLPTFILFMNGKTIKYIDTTKYLNMCVVTVTWNCTSRSLKQGVLDTLKSDSYFYMSVSSPSIQRLGWTDSSELLQGRPLSRFW